MKIYAEVISYACILAILLSVANDFINFVCCFGKEAPFEAWKKMKQFALRCFRAPREISYGNLGIYVFFIVLSLFQHLMTMEETYYLLI